MNKRNKIIVSIVGITIVLLALLGITYAYYLTRIEGNTNTNSISITTADLKLEYGDGNGYIQATNIQPGNDIAKKTFTVTNKGNVVIENYGVYFEEVINTFELKDDVIFTITCTSSLGNNCYGIEDKIFPTSNELIVNNSIAINETHEYEIKVTYKETGVDQSVDMDKEISAKVQIYDMANVIDITGSVSNIEEGDTLVLYSEPKNSKIINGKYKFVGVEPGSHTLYILDSNGEEKYRKEFTLKKGTENRVEGDVLTISEETQKINLDINVTQTGIGMNITSSASKTEFIEGTLAYKLLESAKLGENGTSYRETPLTVPSRSVSNVAYTEKRASSATTEYAPAYYTYCDSFTQDVSTGYFIMENCNTVYYYDDPSIFVGKYTMSASPTSKTATSVDNKTSIYKITSASKTSVSYQQYTRSGSSGSYTYSTKSGTQNLKRNYIIYCDSYIYNQESGTYSLKDCNYGIYVDTYTKVVGKYSPVDYLKGAYGKSNNGSMHREQIYEITEANQDYYKITELSSTKTAIEESNLIPNEDDYGTTYYYRGAVKNNYIEYSDMCWRILRIQGNGTIKLILANEGLCSAKTTKSGLVKNGDSTLRAKFNTDTYNQTTGNDGNYLKSGSTTLKTKIESWYTNNISDKSRTTTTGFCNDDVIVDTYSYKYDNDYIEVAGNATTSKYYNYHRITEYQELPTFKCDDTLFEASVAPVTADELLFAGASYERENRKFYINDEVSGIQFYEWWWSLTPCYVWKGGSFNSEYAHAYYMYEYGTMRMGIVNDYGYTSSAGSIRPVIVLKSNVLYKSGNGTSTNPYKIY